MSPMNFNQLKFLPFFHVQIVPFSGSGSFFMLIPLPFWPVSLDFSKFLDFWQNRVFQAHREHFFAQDLIAAIPPKSLIPFNKE